MNKLLILILSIFASPALAGNLYVDTPPAESGSGWDGVDGHSYTGSPGAGTGYGTVQAGISAMAVGDKLYMRGGIYDMSQTGEDSVSIAGKDGDSWSEGHYFYMGSYPGEWAILDGGRNTSTGVVLHGGFPCYGSDVNSHYWTFERFEVKGGGHASVETTCSGIWVNVGPFKFRYLYIHDNISYSTGDNPAGLSMTEAVDSIIEYCRFHNNGSNISDTHNAAHIIFYGEIGDITATGENGYSVSRGGSINDIVRYNYFTSTIYGVGVKNKVAVFFSGRNPDGGHGWEETYADYGLKIHHNIFDGIDRTPVMIDSDFAQIYQNIFYASGSPNISVSYSPAINMNQFYKVVIYNNTMIEPANRAIVRYGRDNLGETYCPTWQPDRTHYGWDLNNLVEDGYGITPYGEEEIISVVPYASGVSAFNLSNYVGSNNYFFDPDVPDVFRLYDISYTPAEYEGQTVTASPRIVYTTTVTSPFGASGADRFITDPSFIIDGATTIGDGGVGGNHPYLAGVTIPSFVGATKPGDSYWVAGVLTSLETADLTSATSGSDPSWVEVAGDPTPTPTPSPQTVSGTFSGVLR